MVVVEEGRAAARGFEQIFVAVLAAEDRLDIEAGLFGDIDKLDAERCSGDRRWRPFGRGAGWGFIGLAGVARRFGCLRGLLTEGRPRQPQNIFER